MKTRKQIQEEIDWLKEKENEKREELAENVRYIAAEHLVDDLAFIHEKQSMREALEWALEDAE